MISLLRDLLAVLKSLLGGSKPTTPPGPEPRPADPRGVERDHPGKP